MPSLIKRDCNMANARATHRVWSIVLFHHKRNIFNYLFRNRISSSLTTNSQRSRFLKFADHFFVIRLQSMYLYQFFQSSKIPQSNQCGIATLVTNNNKKKWFHHLVNCTTSPWKSMRMTSDLLRLFI